MANKIKIKPVPIELDKPRSILFDFNAWIELEDIYGNIPAAMEKMGSGLMRDVRNILWAGLVHEDPELTIKDVGKILSIADLEEVTKAMIAATEQALPEGNEKSQAQKMIQEMEIGIGLGSTTPEQ